MENSPPTNQPPPSEETGLSNFLATLPQEAPVRKPLLERLKEKTLSLIKAPLEYVRSPEMFIHLRNAIKANLFYLLPASAAAPLFKYVTRQLPPEVRLSYLEYGTLDTLWKANLLSLLIVLILAGFKRILKVEKVEIRPHRHPFFRSFWHWVGANFIYVLPILSYGAILNNWYFLEGMHRAAVLSNFILVLWVIATFFSLLIIGLTGAVELIFRAFGQNAKDKHFLEALEESEQALENKERAEGIPLPPAHDFPVLGEDYPDQNGKNTP